MEHASIRKHALHKGIVYALLAAALFGASTPFAKGLVGQVALTAPDLPWLVSLMNSNDAKTVRGGDHKKNRENLA